MGITGGIKPAQYLIRFDDLCPTMSKERRELLLSILARYGVQPILAVVPDNRDPDLILQDPDPDFWHRLRSLESAGATIAMHGYQHLCRSRGNSLIALHQETEFAGVEESRQREWIRSGLEILRSHGLSPRLFVAPRHGFDRATLRVLAAEGLPFLSDGFAHRPFSRDQVVCVPQQLWEPVPKKSGLWTICIHPNTAGDSLQKSLDNFLQKFSAQFTSFQRVIAEHESRPLSWAEQLAERNAFTRIRISSQVRRSLSVP